MKEDYQKAWKKLMLFFLLNPVPFNGQSYQKQKGSGASDQLLFKFQNKFKNIPLFAIYYLTKCHDAMENRFWFKIYIWKFMQASSWHHNLFHFHLPFWIKKLWKGREKITKIWISREQKELFRWNKKNFS